MNVSLSSGASSEKISGELMDLAVLEETLRRCPSSAAARCERGEGSAVAFGGELGGVVDGSMEVMASVRFERGGASMWVL